MIDIADIELLIVEEVKRIYESISVNAACIYNGCGADDGWPNVKK